MSRAGTRLPVALKRPAAMTFGLPVLVVLATWDAWLWLGVRLKSSVGEAVPLLALVVFLAGVGLARRRSVAAARSGFSSAVLAGVLAFYASSFWWAPAIVRAAIAASLVFYTAYVAAFGERPRIAFWALVALALPVLPSFQFALGYPLRVVSASLSVGLLRLQGLHIERQGTFLLWQGRLVQFDAPCSGAHMMWAGLSATLMACVLWRLDASRTAAAVVVALAMALLGNVLRASSLFYVEAGLLVDAPAWWHDAIGLVTFAAATAVTLWMMQRLLRTEGPVWAC